MGDTSSLSRGPFGDDRIGDAARRLDDQGKRVWRAHGAAVTDAGRRFGYGVAIVVNALIFYAAHQLLAWQVPFVTEAWASVLWAVDLSIGASIVANALYLVYDHRWFKRLGDVVTTAFAFLSTYIIWRVYPFDFGSNWNNLAQLALAGVLVALAIALVVQSVLLLVGRRD